MGVNMAVYGTVQPYQQCKKLQIQCVQTHQQNHNPTRATRLVALVALVALGFRLDPERLGLDLVRGTRPRRSSFPTRSSKFH